MNKFRKAVVAGAEKPPTTVIIVAFLCVPTTAPKKQGALAEARSEVVDEVSKSHLGHAEKKKSSKTEEKKKRRKKKGPRSWRLPPSKRPSFNHPVLCLPLSRMTARGLWLRPGLN
jgi:hypothetical protein